MEAIESALVLSVMRFADELVETDGFQFPAAVKMRKEELQMARALVDNLAAEWNPSKYADDYKTNLMRTISGGKPGRARRKRRAA